MSDTCQFDAKLDLMKAAARYRDRLMTEIELVEAFLRAADGFRDQVGVQEPDCWVFDHIEVPGTLH